MKDQTQQYRRLRRALIHTAAIIAAVGTLLCCGRQEKKPTADDGDRLRQVLYVQSLYNSHPGDDIEAELTAVIDSMRSAGRDPYYFAAVNILIDRLFSDGRFAEADSLAVEMGADAKEAGDSVSMAMAHRVRAQMAYKLNQPARADKELRAADSLIMNPYRSRSEFGTATNIQEWKWIIARELGDTTAMNRAGLRYASMTEDYSRINNWTDTTGHHPVTALAFKAREAFSRGDLPEARMLLDSASKLTLPQLPARAYEHLYEVRGLVRAHDADWEGALADAETLLHTHKGNPWFYIRDLLLKAEVLNLAGRHEESNDAFTRYIEYHDSLSNNITEQRLQDLTVLYRSELGEAHRRAARFRMTVLCAAIGLLLILLGAAHCNVRREKKKNRLLVKRLKEIDESIKDSDTKADSSSSPIDRLDMHIRNTRPYTDPALGRKELAEYLGISQTAVGDLVKNEKGVSVRTYINSFRLEETRKILGSESEEGVAEIAARLGFGTPRTLQRAFKERYGMSPTQYRNAAKEITPAKMQITDIP